MTEKALFERTEAYMLNCLQHDAAHDPLHIYRVLNVALDIARQEQAVDLTVLILSCLLHDVGRPAQTQNPRLCHAQVGAQMAYDFLIQEGVHPEKALAVQAAIRSHRSRTENGPRSIEAKILYDADKIDVTGALGMARSLLYDGSVAAPLYRLNADGQMTDASLPQESCFLREYETKLKRLHEQLYTRRGKEIAASRQEAAQQFIRALTDEIQTVHALSRPLPNGTDEDFILPPARKKDPT